MQGEVDPTPQAGVSPMPTAYRPPPRAAKRAAVAQPIMPWAPAHRPTTLGENCSLRPPFVEPWRAPDRTVRLL